MSENSRIKPDMPCSNKKPANGRIFLSPTKVLKSKLNSINLITAINTWAIPAISYGFSVINWTKTDFLKYYQYENTKSYEKVSYCS